MKGCLWWASHHNLHHLECDKVNDPHSPIINSKIYAWIGWVYNPKNLFPKFKYLKFQQQLNYSEILFIDSYSFIPIAIEFSILTKIFGLQKGLYYTILSSIIVSHLVLSFNVYAHSKIVKNNCHSKDFPYAFSNIFSIIFREAKHDKHHLEPNLVMRYNYDLIGYLFLFLRYIKLIDFPTNKFKKNSF